MAIIAAMSFTTYHVWRFDETERPHAPQAREYRWHGGTLISIYEIGLHDPVEVDCFPLQPVGNAPTLEQVDQAVQEHETELRGL